MPRGTTRKFLAPPVQGLHADLPVHLVPDEYVTAGQNMIGRNGVFIVRPGYAKITTGAQPFTDAGMGGITYIDNGGTQRTFTMSLTKVSEWDGTNWNDRTGSALTGAAADPVRCALYQNPTTSTVVLTNNKDVPRSVTSGNNSQNLTGGVPTAARDVCVAFQRVVFANVILSGTRAPSTLVVSDKDNLNSYPVTNQVTLSDTADTIVAVRALNAFTFVIYKDFSVWIGIGSPSIFPFTYQLVAKVPGPLSSASVIDAHGIHYWLAQDGTIYSFDGGSVQEVGDNIQKWIQADLNTTNQSRSWGFFDRGNDDCWFFYTPSLQTTPNSAIVMNIRKKSISPVQRFADNLTGGFEWIGGASVTWASLSGYTWTSVSGTYPTWASFPTASQEVELVLTSTGAAHQFGQNGTDSGNAIAASFTTPLRQYADDGDKTRLDAIEVFWKAPGTSRTVTVSAVTTDTLATNGTVSTPQSFDIAVDTQHLATFSGLEARWVGVQISVPNGVYADELRGIRVYAYPRQVV